MQIEIHKTVVVVVVKLPNGRIGIGENIVAAAVGAGWVDE
jgi:hypothetical protein